MKTAPNRVCQIEVTCEWQDPLNGLDYDFSAKVIINRHYEAEAVEIVSVDVYDADEPLDSDVAWVLANTTAIRNNLECVAINKALDKVHSADFAMERDGDLL